MHVPGENFGDHIIGFWAIVPKYQLDRKSTLRSLQGIEAQLRERTVPTRIVWGMADRIFSPKNPDYLNRVVPRMMGITRLKNAKLFFPEEHPDIIAREARKLWELSSARSFGNA
jgi:pimeloyl-ACP methyl ester carboxylesterase